MTNHTNHGDQEYQVRYWLDGAEHKVTLWANSIEALCWEARMECGMSITLLSYALKGQS